MRTISFILLGSLLCAVAQASEKSDSVGVYAKVMDHFTHELLKGVEVRVMRSDSSLVLCDTLHHIYRSNGIHYNFDRRYGDVRLPKENLIFRFSKPGYTTHFAHLTKKSIGRREKDVFLGEILLHKVRKQREVELGTAEVRTSKIRMVVKGDTLVYNADAFQLANGSMLDGLLKLLPGFELRDGQIMVNGQYVSSLLVNGEDFFRGDPRVALENLPAFMVHRVKVYRKEHPWSFITKEKNKEDLPLVVDVNLRKEYSVGWVGNLGIGTGLGNHYIGRFFGLRFTNHSRFALYGNANNTNDTREPGTSGAWGSNYQVPGRTEMQTSGLEYLLKDDKDAWKFVGNIKFRRFCIDNEEVTSTEYFQPALVNNTFSRMQREEETQRLRVQTEQRYERKSPSTSSQLSFQGCYQHQRNDALRRAAEFGANPMDAYRAASIDSIFQDASYRLSQMLTYRVQEQRRQRTNLWSGQAEYKHWGKVAHTPDYYSVELNIHAQHESGNTFSSYLYKQGASATASSALQDQLRYLPQSSLNLNAYAKVDYTYRPEWGSILSYVSFNERYRDGELLSYRLDKLGSEQPGFGLLPSIASALQRSFDAPNSYSSQQNTMLARAGATCLLWLGGKWQSHQISVTPELQWQKERLSYDRAELHVTPQRSKFMFTPTVAWASDFFRVSYQMKVSQPDLVAMLVYQDNSDPLNLYHGNPNLLASITHLVDFHRTWNQRKKGKSYRIQGQWEVIKNALAHSQSYDAATGIRTFSPRNIDGNWTASLSFIANTYLDTKRRFFLDCSTHGILQNSVDYVTARSTVNNLTLTESVRFNARLQSCILDCDVRATYWHATSKRENFSTINSCDLTYHCNAQTQLPAGLKFSADLSLLHRIGYRDASMNGLQFVANVRLFRSFLNGRLDVTLDGYDIFHGLSDVSKSINAQGITETWFNNLPSYALIEVVYKLSKTPKKK